MSEFPGVKPAPGPDQPPIPVRLVTLQVRHGAERQDLPRLAEALAAADADLVCLQDVGRLPGPGSDEVDPALLLSRALDMQLAWEPATDGPEPSGHALLSRVPILISDVHPLPGIGQPRSALRTMIELDGAALWVTTTQLSPGPAEDRAAQAAALAALHTDSMETGVLVGDFGSAADALELAPLRERFTEVGRSGRAEQVWVSAGVGGAAASDGLPLVVDLTVQSGV